MAKNEFLSFASSIGANVISQEEYELSQFKNNGFNSGIAKSKELNKVWRQSAFIGHCIAQYISDKTGQDVLDDGDTQKFADLFSEIVGDAIKTYSTAPTTKQGNTIYVEPFGMMKWDTTINQYLFVDATNKQKSDMEWVSTSSIKVKSGVTRDSTNQYDIVLSIEITEGLSSPEINTWYHVFVCTNGVDNKVIFDKTLTPVLPSGFNVYGRVGSVFVTASGEIREFFQIGKMFYWKKLAADFRYVGASANSNMNIPQKISVPPDIQTVARVHYFSWTNDGYVYFYNPELQDKTGVVTNNPATWNGGTGTTDSGNISGFATELSIIPNSQAQIHYDTFWGTPGSGSLAIVFSVLSWEEI